MAQTPPEPQKAYAKASVAYQLVDVLVPACFRILIVHEECHKMFCTTQASTNDSCCSICRLRTGFKHAAVPTLLFFSGHLPFAAGLSASGCALRGHGDSWYADSLFNMYSTGLTDSSSAKSCSPQTIRRQRD